MKRLWIEREVKRIWAAVRGSCEQEISAVNELSSLAWLRMMIELENAFRIEVDLMGAHGGLPPTMEEIVRYVEERLPER